MNAKTRQMIIRLERDLWKASSLLAQALDEDWRKIYATDFKKWDRTLASADRLLEGAKP